MPDDLTEPIGDDELEGLFEPLRAFAAIALAVSGGPDSLALLNLVDRWRRRLATPPEIHVLTVDHRLRPSSAAEALSVAGMAGSSGLPHWTLVWDGPKPAAGIEEAARDARYRLLAEAARAIGAGCIVTAHHRDDQAETVLMRLGRGSGLTGLAGMRAERPIAGLRLLRPLLAVPKSRLIATAKAAGLAFAEDESNSDPRFARPRLRALMPLLAREGIDADGIARAASRLARADAALEHYAAELVARSVTVDHLAVARIAREPFLAAPGEMRLRVLARIVGEIGGADRPPRSDRLEGLAAAVAEGRPFQRTLGGTVARGTEAVVEIWRESGRAPLPDLAVGPGYHGVWDHRFAVAVEEAPDFGLTLGPLGESGRREIGADGRHRASILAAVPAFRVGDRIVAVPVLGYRAPTGPAVTATTHCALNLEFPRRTAAFPRLT